MAKKRNRKLSQIRLSESAKPHELPASDWFELVQSGVAQIEADTRDARVAVLKLPYLGWVHDGQLWITQLTASIRSTWRAWERAWLLDTTSQTPIAQHLETALETALRVASERETALWIEALEYQSTRQRTRKNSIRWVSAEQAETVLRAFGRWPMADDSEPSVFNSCKC